MSDDYLFTGSGQPDPVVERFERMLAVRRFDRPMPELPRAVLGRRWRWAAGIAACLLAAAGTAWLSLRGGWRVESVAGTPMVANTPIDGSRRVSDGNWVTTDAKSKAKLSSRGFATVDIDTNSRVRVTANGDIHTLEITAGKVHVDVDAAPGKFIVETPIIRIVDLGCEYGIEVKPDGTSRIHVISGRIEVHYGAKVVPIHRSARCEVRPRSGFRPPLAENATDEFASAVYEFDDNGDEGALDRLLSQCGPRDTFTLWHLLPKAREPQRGRIYDRIVALVPDGSAAARAGIAALDPATLEHLRKQLAPHW